MTTDFIEDLKDIAHEALEVRDELGAIKDEVHYVTREWSGERVGDGSAYDSKARILPSPWIVDLSQNIRVTEGGAIKQGDLILKQISQDSYPNEKDIDGSSDSELIEKFYSVGEFLYRVINVRKRYATWDIHIRRLKDQTRY